MYVHYRITFNYDSIPVSKSPRYDVCCCIMSSVMIFRLIVRVYVQMSVTEEHRARLAVVHSIRTVVCSRHNEHRDRHGWGLANMTSESACPLPTNINEKKRTNQKQDGNDTKDTTNPKPYHYPNPNPNRNRYPKTLTLKP
jgi:hypothetical protein